LAVFGSGRGLSVRRKCERVFVPRQSAHDWNAIRAYYEAGASMHECQARFGFSNGAWQRAVRRGDLVPRGREAIRRSHQRRDAVELLLAEGLSPAQIAVRLSVSPSTVSFHLRRLGLAARPYKRHDWHAIRSFYDEGHSMRECADRFGFSRASWYAAVARGDVVARPRAVPIDELLARPRSRSHLKGRLLAAGLLDSRCADCGLSAWRGRPLSLQLHHVNGDGSDNRLANLQLLCPNCHSQTENWGGLNKRTTGPGGPERPRPPPTTAERRERPPVTAGRPDRPPLTRRNAVTADRADWPRSPPDGCASSPTATSLTHDAAPEFADDRRAPAGTTSA
jgi:transposase